MTFTYKYSLRMLKSYLIRADWLVNILGNQHNIWSSFS